MWESAWPRLFRRCAALTRGNMDMAGDLAAEVALCLCRQHGRGALRCANLVGLACRLAHLRVIGIWEANARRGRQLERFRIHMATRKGCKVVTSHELMYDEEKNDDIEK